MNALVCRWDQVSLEALLDRGVAVTLVFDEWEAAHRAIDPGLLARVERHYVIRSFDALDALAQLAVEIQASGTAIDRVLSLSEFSQFGAAYLAQLLGLAEPSIATSVLVRDKRAMKQRIAQAGIACARFVSLSTADVEGSVARATRELGYPAVVKPAAGLGSVDTGLVRGEEELRALLEKAAAESAAVQFLMAEEPIDGEEYHVDSVWVDGRPRVFGVSRYLRPRMLVETPGHDNGSILLPEAAEPELYEEVLDLHRRINSALAIGDEITHLELFRRADGQLWFSEIATRFAGGAIPEMYKPFGGDLRELWFDAVFGTIPGTAPSDPGYSCVGWINLAPTETGTILAEPTDEAIARFPYVLDVIRARSIGFEIEQLHPSTWCTMLVLGADDEKQFRQRVEELESALRGDYKMGR